MSKQLSKYHDDFGNPREPKNIWEKLLSPLKVYSPGGGTFEEWDEWEKTSKEKYPVRFWLTEELPSNLQYLYRKYILDPIWWVRYRTTDRSYILKINSLKPGWHDRSERLLHANFQLLVDFVEIEIPRYRSNEKGFNRNKRNPKVGLEYLDWEINDPDCKMGAAPTQSDRALEKKNLYLWWTEQRPYRWNVWDCPAIWGDNNSNMTDQTYKANDLANALEMFYNEQDDEMLSRLIKIRHSLWT